MADRKRQHAALVWAPARPGIALNSGCTVCGGGRLTAKPRIELMVTLRVLERWQWQRLNPVIFFAFSLFQPIESVH